MRAGAHKDGAPLPITPRQEEAVIRLAEGSARMRLSETVSADDVRVAMTLMDACLRDVAYDAETGQFDIDRLYSGTSQKDRDCEREVEALVRDAGGKIRVSEVFESLISKGYGLEPIERTLKRMESCSGYSTLNGMLYHDENRSG